MPETIGIFANRALRDGPDSLLIRFVREFEPYLRQVLKPRIYALEGTFRALLRHGLLHGYSDLHPLPPGRQGGIVALTDRVVESGLGGGKPRRPMDCVIYFMDSRDPTSMLPDSVALKRECVLTGTAFLATFAAAADWYGCQWFTEREDGGADSSPPLAQYFLDLELIDALLPASRDRVARQAIALIAHDSKKVEMVDFAAAHHGLLSNFGRRLATGTTGTLLNGRYPQRLTRQWDEVAGEAELFQRLGTVPARLERALAEQAALEAAVARLEPRLGGEPWVDAQPSGPRGGDIQIAEIVRQGGCQKLLFFEDPLVSREHEADIQLLERTTRIPGHEVSCLHDARSAARWATNLARCIALGTSDPMTIFQAYRELFGVELILSDLAPTGAGPEDEAVWRDVLDRAAWYVHGLLAKRGRERHAEGEVLRVAVTWGREIHELIDAMATLPRRLAELDECHPELHQPLFDKNAMVPCNLLALPTIGIVGTTDPRNEASFNAAGLANAYAGSARSLPLYAFCEEAAAAAGLEAMVGELSKDWDRADLVVSTCDRLRLYFSEDSRAPIPGALHRQLEAEAVGEIAGIYIDRAGQAVIPRHYSRIGMTRAQLQRVARGGGSIFIAAVQERRVLPALAALRGGLVSTLVSDVEFARRILLAQAGEIGPEEGQ